MAVHGGGGDNRMGALEVCTVFRIKVMAHNAKPSTRSKIFVCQNGGQYTPVVLMLGKYRGSMEEKYLKEKFYRVEHGPEYLNEFDAPLGE